MALLQCNFFSQALMLHRAHPGGAAHRQKPWAPAARRRRAPFKTLYLLHGIFGNDTDWVCGTRVQSWAQDRNLAVVMPSGDNSFYVDNPQGQRLLRQVHRPGAGGLHPALFPPVHPAGGYLPGRPFHGGFGAIVNGLQHPQTFGAVAALSSALILDSMLEHTQYTDFLMTNKGYYESVFGELSQVRGGVNDYDALAEKVAKEPVRPKFYPGLRHRGRPAGRQPAVPGPPAPAGLRRHLRRGPRRPRLVLLGRVHLKSPELAAPVRRPAGHQLGERGGLRPPRALYKKQDIRAPPGVFFCVWGRAKLFCGPQRGRRDLAPPSGELSPLGD